MTMTVVYSIHILLLSAVLVAAYHGPDLPPGPYCGKTNQCCQDRQDECSHPILDTLCYCDEHCNRTHDDCCPDYEEVCLGQIPSNTPPPISELNICEPGTKRRIDCNECICGQTSRRRYDWICGREECMMSDEVVAMVNQGESWTATKYQDFATKKLKDGLVYKLGTMPLDISTRQMGALHYNKEVQYPSYFDARMHWPGYISPIVDQGWCGSDWAVAIAGVASDRFAIQSNGVENVRLSPQTMLSCNVRGQKGCEGGRIDVAWNFASTHGLLDEICFPYKAMKTPCPYKPRDDLIKDYCRPSVPKRTSRYKVGPPGRLQAEEDIMYDIKESGPVHAIMTVYQDFFHYRSGIYRHTSYGNEVLEGHHSVRIIGWGEERGEKYWIVANSWGTQWGEDGYFRIKRGVNECGIESFVITVLAEVTEA